MLNYQAVIKSDTATSLLNVSIFEYKYYTIKEETAKPVSLTYKGTGADNYLEAVYKANAGTGSTTAYGTDAATAQTIVDNGNIVALYEGRKALKDLGEAQITAINAVQSAAAVKTAAQNYANAYDAVNTSGSQAAAGANVWNQTDPATYTPALSSLPTHKGTGDTLTAGDVFIVTSDEVDASTLTAGAKVEVKKALTNYTTAEQAFNNAKQDLTDAIDALHTTAIQNGTETEANVAALQTAFDNAANAYYTAANNLKDAYANIESQIHDSGLLTGAAASTSITSLTGLVDAAKTMDTTGGASGYRNVLDGYIDAYESAAHTNESNIADMETKYGLYKTACEGYTTAKDNAETAYGTAVTTFNTEKLKSKSTDGLTAKSFAEVVADVVIETADSAATPSEDNVMVEKTGDGYDKAQSKAKADLAKAYAGTATDAATLTPMVTGTTPDYDTTNNEVADTNYQGTVTELTNALTSSTTVYNDAKTALAAYNDSNVNAAANAEHTIKVKINLADGVKNDATWSQIPKADDDTVAHFYLNKILEAGETSDMLIKSVELDGETTTPASFKDMTFDLNVALKSAQVTYDDNNNILATAADTTFNNAKVNGDDNRVVTITDGKIGWTQVTTP